MRCYILSVFVALTFVLLAQNSFACLELRTAKASYFSGETAQLEIDATTTRALNSQDISVYRNEIKLPTAIFMSKIGETKYFAWFDFPSEPGVYKIRVRGYCPELKVVELSIDVQQTIASRHLILKEKVRDKWKTLPLETHILAAGALSYDEIASQAFSDYIKRADSCFNANCGTNEAVLTLSVFESSLLKEKMLKLLDAYQNYLGGEWHLMINSQAAQKCNLNIATINITETLDINKGTNFVNLTTLLTNITAASILIELSCESNATATLAFSKNGFNKSFKLLKENNKLVIELDNSGCWGNGFKTKCNTSSTAHALVALASTGNLNLNNSAHLSALTWLQANAKTTEERALLYYITQKNEILDELVRTQSADGFWLNELYKPDVRGTTIAVFALKSSNETASLTKAQSWLKKQELALSDEAFVLFFAFPFSEIEPIVAIWPGLIKTASQETFNLMLTNKGNIDVKLNATFLNSSTAIELKKGEMKNIQFKMPIAMTIDGRALMSTLALDYSSVISESHYFYNIPLLIFTEKGEREQIGQLITTEQKINQTTQQIIINETVSSPIENKTTEINVSLLQERFSFVEKNITAKLNRTETFVKKIILKNTLDKKIKNIELSPSYVLQQGNLVKVEPSSISAIEAGRSANITVYINPALADVGIHSGAIQATASYDTTKITTYIPLTIEIVREVGLLNCSEMNGIECEIDGMICETTPVEAADTLNCCIPATSCKKKVPVGRNIGLIIVAVIVAILVVVLFLLKRKPKKEMKEFLEEKAKEFEMKKIRRPPTIAKPPSRFL